MPRAFGLTPAHGHSPAVAIPPFLNHSQLHEQEGEKEKLQEKQQKENKEQQQESSQPSPKPAGQENEAP